MSAIAYSYSDPYRLPAGALALLVHGAFFALLYFGVNWHTDQPQGMEVEIWDSLPAPQPEPVKVEAPPVQEEPPKPVEQPRPVEPPKAEIALPEKKKPKVPEPKPVVETKTPPLSLKQTPPKISEAEKAQQAAQAEQERVRAAQEAATGKVVNEFVTRITAKIKRNIVMPPDVPENAETIFYVTLLPGGSVLSTKRVKPSGNQAYDDAVDRAITKAQPLPLPPDVTMFSSFRELHLIFRPKEKE